MKTKERICAILILLLLLPAGTAQAQTTSGAEDAGGVVRAVLFYSPTCPHCHEVINNVLPPLAEEHGEQLAILLIDVSKERGSGLYQAMVSAFELPRERWGVPALVVASTVLVGSEQIPAQLPGMIEEGLAQGGIGWPAFPGFDAAAAEAVFAERLEPEAAPEETGAAVEETSGGERDAEAVAPAVTEGRAPDTEQGTGSIQEADGEVVGEAHDAVGFVLAALVTLVMVGALGYVVTHVNDLHQRLQRAQRAPVVSWFVPALAALGLGIALYLTYVELNQMEAVCGPVGECNMVQSSPYARIFGVPVALLGVLNYLIIGLLWWGQRRLRGVRLRMATTSLLVVTVAGTLFSIYLTLLELFVIEAVCMWCLSSAMITAGLMVVVAMSIMERVSVPEREMAFP